MEPIIAHLAGDRAETISRVQAQVATSGQINLDDFKLVYGDPMKSVSFRDLHDSLQHEAELADQFLRAQGITYVSNLTPPSPHLNATYTLKA